MFLPSMSLDTSAEHNGRAPCQENSALDANSERTEMMNSDEAARELPRTSTNSYLGEADTSVSGIPTSWTLWQTTNVPSSMVHFGVRSTHAHVDDRFPKSSMPPPSCNRVVMSRQRSPGHSGIVAGGSFNSRFETHQHTICGKHGQRWC